MNLSGLKQIVLLGAVFMATGSVPARASAPAGAPYPWGDTFWFSFYSLSEADIVYAQSKGLTGIGPYYDANQSGVLGRAVTNNTFISYKVRPACLQGVPATTWRDDPSYVWPSDATIIADTVAAVSAVATNTRIGMWDINPEELRHWKPAELRYLRLVTDTVRANDPYGRPVTMYEPNHRNAAGLSQTLPHQDICGKGMYVNDAADPHNRIWARWSMEQELAAVAAVNTNANPWIVLWMAADAPEGEESLINDWCRHDAYMGLIMGGKGISIWSGYRNRAGFLNDFQAYFDGYLTVANDLNGPLNLGPVFLYGKKQNGVTAEVTAGPEQVELIYNSSTNCYPPVAYTTLLYNDRLYLFMVNSAEEPVTVRFSGLPGEEGADLFSEGTTTIPGGSFSVTLNPYEVKGYELLTAYDIWRNSRFSPAEISAGAADMNTDADADGLNNWAEYVAGTDPRSAGSLFRMAVGRNGAGVRNLSFPSSSNRLYTVYFRTNLLSGEWLPLTNNLPGTGGLVAVSDTNTFKSSFYRIHATIP